MRLNAGTSAALVVAVMLGGALVGCASDGDGAGASGSAAVTSTAGTPSTSSPATTTVPPTSSAAGPTSGSAPTTPAETVVALTSQLGPEFVKAPGGGSLESPTFSQCNFEYDTERLRKSRMLVVRGGSSGPLPSVSVEAVAYDFEDTATLAVTEIRTAVKGCSTGDTYTDLPAADQVGLTKDHVATALKTKAGGAAHLIVVRRGVVVVVVIGTDTVSADSTARTMSLLLGQYPAPAVGL